MSTSNCYKMLHLSTTHNGYLTLSLLILIRERDGILCKYSICVCVLVKITADNLHSNVLKALEVFEVFSADV